MRQRKEPFKGMPTLEDRRAPSIAESSDMSTWGDLSNSYITSDCDDGDTVSLSSDTASAATVRANSSQERNKKMARKNVGDDSIETSPDPSGSSSTSSLNSPYTPKSGTWQSPHPQNGYFVLPDPLSLIVETNASSAHHVPDTALFENSKRRIVEDDIATELCGSPRAKRAQSLENERSRSIAIQTRKDDHFLPLLENEFNQPGVSGPEDGPTIEGKQHSGTNLGPTQHPVQFDAQHPAAITMSTVQQAEPGAPRNDEQLKIVQSEVEKLAAGLRALKQSTVLESARHAEEVETLRREQEQLVGGWERMRNELLEIKVSQEKLRQDIKMSTHSENMATEFAQSSREPRDMVRHSFASSWSAIEGRGEVNLDQGPALSTNITYKGDSGGYFHDRNPPTSVTRNITARPSSGAGRVPNDLQDPALQGPPPTTRHSQHLQRHTRGCTWFYCPICRGEDGSGQL